MTGDWSMDEPLVVATDLRRCFGPADTPVQAVRDASASIGAGQQIALTGPSGSGKSTLLHLLGGLDTPDSGLVTWPALGERENLRPGKVADIFQGPSLLTPLTIIDNVRLPLLMAGCDERESTLRSMDVLALFNVDALAAKLPEEISGGQAQRVAIARAVAIRPALILADEPTGQLDSQTAVAVLDTLLRAAAESGAAIVISTHDLRIADRLPTKWSMRDGCLTTAHQPVLASR
jgi:ABC-type lipoprotein export system ATPase subunit